MKISIAQTRPVKGDINKNIEIHKSYIQIAIENKSDFIIFPELSLTGYEPDLARELATNQSDSRLDVFQDLSNSNKITICLGLPTKIENSIFISMIIFQPNKERITYSKQHLFPTEIEVFTKAHNPLILQLDEKNTIAPAICYELSNPDHSENAKNNNANIYIASVLNSFNGIEDDINKLSNIAYKHKMTVFMANYGGESGGYKCAGRSSIWNDNGELIKQLDSITEGILQYNTETKSIEIFNYK